MPLFWPLLDRAGAVEILAHRMLWSFVIAGLPGPDPAPRGWWRPLANRRTLILLGLAAAVIAVNWGLYIWSVNSGQVVEAALGYYINPILTVLLGVIVLGSGWRVAQWVALGFAAAAVLILTVDYGRLPWIALTLAVSFASYGLLKNRINSGAVATLDRGVGAAHPARARLSDLPAADRRPDLRPPRCGPQPAADRVPDWSRWFRCCSSAPRPSGLPLSTLGLLQYLTPTAQFLLGVFYFGEAMPPARWAGFALIWVALLILSGYGLFRAVGQPRRPS